MFVDKVIVHVKAGRGGNGAVSFRHEKYVEKGGPDGGNGGKGGNVVLVADANQNTLVNFRYKQDITARDGEAGSKRDRHGRSAEDTEVKVPVGTQVFESDRLLADLTEVGQRAVVARGGDGGFGNAHFKSSTRQAPKVAEIGEKGEEMDLTLELKLLADVGLIGFPNAGKSTFLSVVSNARPEIADYPFTTLTPNLGVADIDETSLLVADIPGLIEGASQGRGLGDAFLRHVERTSVLIHLIDIYEDDVAGAYTTINNELKAYSKELAKRPQLVALTKVEGLPQDGVDQKLNQIRKVAPKNTKLFAISSQAHLGLSDVLRQAAELVRKVRVKEEEQKAEGGLPVIQLDATKQALAWKVRQLNGIFYVTGTKIEKFAARTDFSAEPGRRRLRDIMSKMGITHELVRQGAEPSDRVVIGKSGGQSLSLAEGGGSPRAK